jgi:hypothetical protein
MCCLNFFSLISLKACLFNILEAEGNNSSEYDFKSYCKAIFKKKSSDKFSLLKPVEASALIKPANNSNFISPLTPILFSLSSVFFK